MYFFYYTNLPTNGTLCLDTPRPICPVRLMGGVWSHNRLNTVWGGNVLTIVTDNDFLTPHLTIPLAKDYPFGY